MPAMERGNFCPLLRKKCIGLKCAWYIEIMGKNPNTGQEFNNWDCSIVWLPTLLINNAKETLQTAAAVESFRNEVVKSNDGFINGFMQLVNNTLRNNNPDQKKVTFLENAGDGDSSNTDD